MAESTGTRRKDVTAGALFIAIAACFLFLGKDLELGTPRNMGPGFFPLLVVILIAALGAGILVGGLRKPKAAGHAASATSAVASDSFADAGAGLRRATVWRPLACILGSVMLFAVLVEPFGLAPALGFAVLIATLGGSPWKPLRSIILSILITLFCWLVFVVALGMPMPLVAWPGV